MSVSLGTDIECLTDLQFNLVSGTRNVALALARRLTTPKGSLWYATGYGFDLNDYINADVTSDTLNKIRQGVVEQCKQDERVDSVNCQVTWSPSTKTIVVAISCTSSKGPFSLVMGIGSVSVDVLKIDG